VKVSPRLGFKFLSSSVSTDHILVKPALMDCSNSVFDNDRDIVQILWAITGNLLRALHIQPKKANI
jgi:hypothetical protein